jgi:hypothetical protein
MINTSMLEQSFTECLKLTDKIIFTSLGLLCFGIFIPKITHNPDNEFSIPVIGLHVASFESALWLIVFLHFCNSLRFLFVVLRAVAIAKRLPREILSQLQAYPAFITSNRIVDVVTTVSMGGMEGLIIGRLNYVSLCGLLLICIFSSVGFIIGQVKANRVLDFE